MEATKFRPREVVKGVLQTAAGSLQRMLTLEGHVADDVPVQVRVISYRSLFVMYLVPRGSLVLVPLSIYILV